MTRAPKPQPPLAGQLGLFTSAAAPVAGENVTGAAAATARDDGERRAYRHAEPEWREAARKAITSCAETLPSFTTDDVWQWLETNAPDVTTHEPSAMGPLVRWAMRAGLCERTTSVVTNSSRPQHHGELRVYRSLVCAEQGAA